MERSVIGITNVTSMISVAYSFRGSYNYPLPIIESLPAPTTTH